MDATLTVAYRSRELFYTQELVWRPGPRDDAPFGNVIVIGGQVVGIWKRSVVKEVLQVEPRWFNPPARCEETAFAEAAERYAAFATLSRSIATARTLVSVWFLIVKGTWRFSQTSTARAELTVGSSKRNCILTVSLILKFFISAPSRPLNQGPRNKFRPSVPK